jgi:hypothetical protein
MRALTKSRAAAALWLAEVPEPEIGINDVLNFRRGNTGATRPTETGRDSASRERLRTRSKPV